jgi:hypothetical protein
MQTFAVHVRLQTWSCPYGNMSVHEHKVPEVQSDSDSIKHRSHTASAMCSGLSMFVVAGSASPITLHHYLEKLAHKRGSRDFPYTIRYNMLGRIRICA